MKALAHLLIAMGVATNSLAATPNCGAYPSPFLGRSVGYCIDRSRPDLPANDDEPVVYFLHGAFMSSAQWYLRPYARDLRALAKTEELPPFTIVAFDTEPLDFFSDRANIPLGPRAYESWFLREFIPLAEKQFHLCARRECRGIAGTSMGGFGALKIALRHPELFAFAAGDESAILPANPYDHSMSEWREYFSTKPVGSLVGLTLIAELKNIFPTRELYDENDPAILALDSRWRHESPPAIYFDVTGGDEFGFYDGFRRFESALRSGGLDHTSYIEPDGSHADTKGCRTQLLKFVARQLRF